MKSDPIEKAQWLCIIGSPVAHSASPSMHQAAIDDAGLNAKYIALDVDEQTLVQSVQAMRILKIKGFNVTMPVKQAILPLLDELDEEAAVLGAVNTVRAENGRLKGFSTDGAGYIEGLKQDGVSVAGKKVFIFGAGGAGKAIIYALCAGAAETVYYCVRSEKSVKDCENMLNRFVADTQVRYVQYDAREIGRYIYDCDIIINSTPQGMGEHACALLDLIDFGRFRKDVIVSDIVYHPLMTPFLKAARQHGLQICTGEKMVLHQAALSFEIWFEQKPALEKMRAALERSIAKSDGSRGPD